MSTTPMGAHFEIKVDGMVRSYRDQREAAIDAARVLQVRNPASKITVTDTGHGSVMPFDQPHR